MNQEASQKLVELLVQGEFINEKQLQEAQTYATQNKKTLQEALVVKEFMSDEHLGQLVAQVSGWQFVNLAREGVDEKICKIIPERVAKAQMAIPFAKTNIGVKVAMVDPSNTNIIHLYEKRLGQKVIPFFATAKGINEHFNLYKVDIKEELSKIVQSDAAHAVIGATKDNSTVQIVDMLLQRGYESDASDIHIEPHEEDSIARFRIDGVMNDILTIPKTAHDLIISRIKVLSKLRTDEHLVPQDGKLQFQVADKKIDVRVSIVPTIKGENVVMRILSDKAQDLTLESIGLNTKDITKLSETIKKPWGMILVTGPTGSGKTTTLYSIMKIINKREINIATIEDPVEYNIDGVTQIQVNPRTKLTFAAGLKSIVRQDPDVIMVGEIRDQETAEIAVNSAMTGHLVLSTLHTNDAATTLPRILDMGIEPFLVSSTINVVIAQRLVRKICPKCIKSYDTDLAKLSQKMPIAVLEKLARGKENITLYKGIGCELCNKTGYEGRIGIFEILEIDDEIRRLIMEHADADKVKAKAIENGMTTMFDDAREKVLNGQTTIEEMLRVVKM